MSRYERNDLGLFMPVAVSATVGTIGTLFVMPGGAVFAWLVWAVGITCISGTIGIVLDLTGLRHWAAAMALGAISTFVIVFAYSTNLFTGQSSSLANAAIGDVQTWKDHSLTSEGWHHATTFAVKLAGIGALAGLAFWRTGYERVEHPR